MGDSTPEEIKLPDGRSLSITRYGSDSLEIPFIYLHGFPGSRIEAEVADKLAKDLGISLISVDRPGFGRTPSWPKRRLLEFPALIEALAAKLGVEKFGLLALSGGAPYAFATAAALGDRVAALGIVSGMGEMGALSTLAGMVLPNKSLLLSAKYTPSLAFGSAWLLAAWWKVFPSHMVRWLQFFLRGDDAKILARPEVSSFLTRNVAEALAVSPNGAAQEVPILAAPWEFKISAIKPKVILWHGEADFYVPISFAERIHAQLPNGELRRCPGKGHFMVLDMLPAALAELKREFLIAQTRSRE